MDRRLRCLSLVLVGLLATGCSYTDLVPFLPSAPASDTVDAPECFGIHESVDRDPYTVETLLRVAEWIVIADVVAIGDGFWDTPGGQPPDGARPALRGAGIVTPVDITVREVVAGAGVEGDARVVVEGGAVGCVVHTVDPAPPVLVPGDRYALVMVPNMDATGVQHPEQPLVLEAWPIDANGDIVTVFDGTLTAEELAGMAGG